MQVMVLDESVAPFSRIWCLFEVKRLTDLKKARGPLRYGAPGARVFLGQLGEPKKYLGPPVVPLLKQTAEKRAPLF